VAYWFRSFTSDNKPITTYIVDLALHAGVIQYLLLFVATPYPYDASCKENQKTKNVYCKTKNKTVYCEIKIEEDTKRGKQKP